MSASWGYLSRLALRDSLGSFVSQLGWPGFGDLQITSASTERQKRSQNLAPVLEIIPGNSLVFSRKIITSTGFYRCCAPGASAPVVVKNRSPMGCFFFFFRSVDFHQNRKGKQKKIRAVPTIGAKMITFRKNCFDQLIFELHRITVHLLSFARINFRL